ncbi:hypothetical protein V6B16_11960 [Salinimicrobium catena]|uniref:hypothetical protein n=1 Tax=Salinimicrobium catena TaxID=390640 RepID=UPI002FE43D32
MKKLIFTAVLFVNISIGAAGQELDQYQYVRVPEKFDFLNEDNQYQLNALTAFLFEKFGFTALYEEPTPEGVQPCEILDANVHDESSIFSSKVYVTLRDCKKEVVFTSRTGTSREKDYKDSYHEALRDAFKSIEELQHSFTGEVVIDPVISVEEKEAYEEASEVDSLPAEIIVDPVVTSEEREELKKPAKTRNRKTVAGTYMNGAVSYELKKTAVGFDLFKKGETEVFAKLINSGSGENYLYSSASGNGNAYFDAQGNLVAEYFDANSGQVITVTYRKDQ